MESSGPEMGRIAEPALLILLSLADGPKHAYAIMTDVDRAAGHAIGPGTLQATLGRLEAARLIEVLPASNHRHPYGLTTRGAAQLEAHLRAMSRFAKRGLDRLRTAGT